MTDYSGHLAQADREKALFDDKLNQLLAVYEDLRSRHDSTVSWMLLMDAVKDVEQWKINATLAAAVHRISEAS